MHISFESETAFELWNKVKRIERSKQYNIKSIHFNTESDPNKPWIITAAKKEDFDAV